MDAEVDEQEAAPRPEAIALLHDRGRLAALSAYAILDTAAEPSFDDLARLAAQLCQAPLALVCLMAADRLFVKARFGPPLQIPLDESLGAAMLKADDLLVIPDLSHRHGPGRPPLAYEAGGGFFAGAPLRTSQGHVLGMLCVLDRAPRPGGLAAAEAVSLTALARQVMGLIESRRALMEYQGMLGAQRRMTAQQAALIQTQDIIANAKGDLDTILDALVAGAMNAVDAAEGGVVELLQDRHLVHRWARGTLKPHTGVHVPLEASLAGACFLSNRPLLCADALVDSRTTPGLAQQLGTRSCLMVPVSRGGKVIGVLKLQAGGVGVFTEHDLQVVRLFAGTAAAGFADASAAASRRAARSAEGRYRAIFESAIDFAIVVMDLDGLITDWNEGAVRTLGWSRDEIMGRPVELFFTPEDRTQGIPHREMRSALLDGRGVDERWHLRKDGQRFWANGEMMTLRADDGKAIGFLKILRDRTTQHEAAERLLASERRVRLERGLLQAVVQQAPVGITIAFADGEPAMVNARMLAMMGPAEIVKETRVAGERRLRRRTALDEALTRALRRGEVLSNEVVRREDSQTGEMHHWMLSSTPIVGQANEVLAAVTVVVDADEQRRSLRALEVSEERLALAFEASGSLGWWDWDIKRDLFFASTGLAQAYGVDPAAAARGVPISTFIDGIYPPDRAAMIARVETTLATGGEFGEEYRLQADGPLKWVYARGRCSLDDAGKPVRFPGVVIDITARKAIEAAVAAKQAEMRTLIEAVPVGILLAEAPSGRITAGNQRVEQILGHPIVLSPDWAGYDAYVAHHDDGTLVRAEEWPLARIVNGLCDRASIEVRYKRPNGQAVWIAISGEAIKDADGQTVGGVVAIVDIEDRKLAEANQALLNHELSHRMKNTLAMVQAVAAQTLRNAVDLPGAREALDSRLIALGKAHDILLQGETDRADVAAVIEGALDMHDDGQGRIVANGPALPIASSAALSLALLVHELATNAVKYGSLSVVGGRVAVTWTIDTGADDDLFVLDWREVGGPSVVAPTRKGFGSRLIERGFGSAPGCAVTLSYDADGVACVLQVPMLRLQAP